MVTQFKQPQIMSFESFNYQNPGSLSYLELDKNVLPASVDAPFTHLADNKTEENRQFVYLIQESAKEALVVNILRTEQLRRVVIYVRTNSAADQVAEKLNRSGIMAESVHDNKSQRTRIRSFSNFRSNATDVLVATESAHFAFNTIEVAAIINYDLPVSAETYVERLTRHPSHNGVNAKVFSFCDKSENSSLTNINRALNGDLAVIAHNID